VDDAATGDARSREVPDAAAGSSDAARDDAATDAGRSPGDADADADSAPLPLDRRWTAHCAERAAQCGGTPAECENRRDCYSQWWRPEYAAAYLDCVIADGCAADDDECSSRAIGTAAISAEGRAVDAMCLERREACGGSFAGAGDTGVCHVLIATVLSEGQLAAFVACLDQPCDQVARCIRDAEPAACNGGG
jgi:hypothetical protein